MTRAATSSPNGPIRLGYFAMPVHPLHRSHTQTLKEDREAIILADKLGFHDAFIGEHLADKAENIPNSMLFLATLIHSTKNIKLGTGTTTIAHMHPVQVAAHAAMFDHLAEGRFILGISPGTGFDAEALGLMHEDRNKIFAEAIDIILAIWEGAPPYDIDLPGNRFKVSTKATRNLEIGVGIFPKPYQKPRPEIVGTVVAPFSKGVIAMGQRDFHPLSANFLLDKWLPSHWQNYGEGKAKAGVAPDPGDWRIARTVCVADDDKTAHAYGRTDPRSPYRFYYSQIMAKFFRGGRQVVFKEQPTQADSEITLDYVVDKLVITGSVNKVVDELLAFHERVGHFGELVYGGMDWVDERVEKRSMELMATEVMPRVNAALKRSQPAAAATADAAVPSQV
jgi:alkanesulfonate monooxygenase SsuD/methylene tetrahydromethanopterin reductase-like flavin-dependent oxidoreductase (luciferase family)